MNRRIETLPIWRDVTRLAVEMERAVRNFPRYHKYALGSDLRRQAMLVCRGVTRAFHAETRQERLRTLDSLVLAVEDLKLLIQLAKELQAFAGFAEFARIAELAVLVGKQSGGWRKSARAKARPEVQAVAATAAA